MEHNKNALAELFEKVYNNKATDEEKKLADRWYNHLDLQANSAPFAKAKEEEIRILMLGNLQQHIAKQPNIFKLRQLPLWVRNIAAVLVFALFSFGIYSAYHMLKFPETYVEVAGKRTIRTVVLPDGTKVTLNKSAQISWDSDFNKKDRKVSLVGEAFFDVKKIKQHPFILQSGNLATTVLGTAFNVAYYKDENQISIALVRGLVNVANLQNHKQHAHLKPGQMITYDKDSHKLEVKTTMVENPAAWIEGNMVFNDVALAAAIGRLKEQYHLNIKYDKIQLQGKKATATFSKATTWQEMLQSILFIHDMGYIEKNGIIYIK